MKQSKDRVEKVMNVDDISFLWSGSKTWLDSANKEVERLYQKANMESDETDVSITR